LTLPNDYYTEANIETGHSMRTAMIAGNQITKTQVIDLFIFRTNIKEKEDFVRLKNDLEKKPGIHSCTIDLEDCDRVLRVECENLSIDKVVEEVNKHNFFCQELED
jgi:hypothetical protein